MTQDGNDETVGDTNDATAIRESAGLLNDMHDVVVGMAAAGGYDAVKAGIGMLKGKAGDAATVEADSDDGA